MNGEQPDQLVQSVDRTLNILEMLVEADEGMGVTEISNKIDIHKSTVHRLLATLQYRGYVKKAGNDKYKIGFKLFEVGSSVINNLNLRGEVKPYLKELKEISKETVHLGVLDNNKVVYIDKVESNNTIRMYSKIGRRNHASSTSLGKVLLAYSERSVVDQVIKEEGLKKLTENTIHEEEAFRKHLSKVRNQGYAIDDEEQEYGIRCIAGPIFDYEGNIIASFSVSGPTMRMTESKVESLKEVVKEYSVKISEAFGYNGF